MVRTARRPEQTRINNEAKILRYPKTIKFRLSDKEKRLYNGVSEYVVNQYNKALHAEGKRNIAFALLILQRRMASSTYALLKSLERRKARLQELIKEPELPRDVFSGDLEEIEDYEEERRWEQEKKWESLSIAENKDELRREIRTLSELIDESKDILQDESEVKLAELKRAIEEGFKRIRKMEGNEKILIFTESKDTMEYLVKRVKSWGYSVNFIHGGMKLEERVEAEKIFKHKTQILIATEAAGEGINLQFCHLMINYDIPWKRAFKESGGKFKERKDTLLSIDSVVVHTKPEASKVEGWHPTTMKPFVMAREEAFPEGARCAGACCL